MSCSDEHLAVRASTIWSRPAIWWSAKSGGLRKDLTDVTITVTASRKGVTHSLTVTKTDAAQGEFEFGPADLNAAPAMAGAWALIFDWSEDGKTDRAAVELMVEEPGP